jgi:hypothetical protein
MLYLKVIIYLMKKNNLNAVYQLFLCSEDLVRGYLKLIIYNQMSWPNSQHSFLVQWSTFWTLSIILFLFKTLETGLCLHPQVQSLLSCA